MDEYSNRSSVEEPAVQAAEAIASESVEGSAMEASSRAPMESLWKDGRNPDPSRICTARRTNGEPCRKTAIKGGNVCMTHGGAAPAVRAKARARLEMAADRMAKELLKIAVDPDAPLPVKLAAIKDGLDRAGLSAKTAVEVQVGPMPEWEQVLTDAVAGGSRADSRAARGVETAPTPDWMADELEVMDAEVVDDEPAPVLVPRERPAPAPATQLLPMEDALEQLRRTSPPPAPVASRRRRH